jgi:opacity protein-like surface antigen
MPRMLVPVGILVIAILALASPAPAQDKFEAFGGYSYFYASDNLVGEGPCATLPCPSQTASAHANLNGWEGSVSYQLFGSVSAVGDVDGNYGSLSSAFSSPKLQRQMYLGGVQFAIHGRISPFAHFLFGISHESLGAGAFTISGTSYPFPSTTGNSFAFALGGGVDFRLAPYVRLRAVQVEYVGTTAYSNTQNQARVSTGLVLHF